MVSARIVCGAPNRKRLNFIRDPRSSISETDIPRRELLRARTPHSSQQRASDLAVAHRPGRPQGSLSPAWRRIQGVLVGGSVRDLLLGADARRTSTSAPTPTRRDPAAVPQLPADRAALPAGAHHLRGRQGRRGGDVPRRAGAPSRSAGGTRAAQTSDNMFGTPREDALRRDFTINGALLRHRRLLGHRLRRRPRGSRERGCVRTIGDPDDPIPGRSGAHDARRRIREPARVRNHAGHVRGDPAAPKRDRESPRRRASPRSSPSRCGAATRCRRCS